MPHSETSRACEIAWHWLAVTQSLARARSPRWPRSASISLARDLAISMSSVFETLLGICAQKPLPP